MMDTGSTTGNVIALNSKDADMAHPLMQSVLHYWDTLRDGRLVPLREEIDPRAIQNALSYSFILDRTRPGSVRFRLSGMHLNEVLGMEARGMPVRVLCQVTHRQQFMAHVEAVFEKPAVMEAHLQAESQARDSIHARLMLLPLRTHSGEINRALGVFVCDNLSVQPPVRFATMQYASTPLAEDRSVFDGIRSQHPAAGLAEEASVFQPQRHRPIRRHEGPKLRVLQGGKD